jgi:hypothetical protein
MSEKDDPQARKLPVTAELGDEGGSYGDATIQAETFSGASGNPRIDPKRVAGTEAPAVTREDQPGEPADAVKHATERPDDRTE